jgi:hypothetical protein
MMLPRVEKESHPRPMTVLLGLQSTAQYRHCYQTCGFYSGTVFLLDALASCLTGRELQT